MHPQSFSYPHSVKIEYPSNSKPPYHTNPPNETYVLEGKYYLSGQGISQTTKGQWIYTEAESLIQDDQWWINVEKNRAPKGAVSYNSVVWLDKQEIRHSQQQKRWFYTETSIPVPSEYFEEVNNVSEESIEENVPDHLVDEVTNAY